MSVKLTELVNSGERDSQILIKEIVNNLTPSIKRIHEAVTANFPTPHCVVLQKTTNALKNTLREIKVNGEPYFKNGGQCAGESFWLLALYLHFKAEYPHLSSDKVLTEITKEFNDGADLEPALLQLMQGKTDEVFGALGIDTESPIKLKNTPREILEQISTLVDGVYRLSFAGFKEDYASIPGHASVLIVEDKKYYFFEPNVGLAGWGADLGSGNQEEDAKFMLSMCAPYSPYFQAQSIFQKGLDNLTQVFTPETASVIQGIAKEFSQEEVPCLSAYAVLGIIDGYKKRGTHFTEAQKEALWEKLSINPGMVYTELNLQQSITLRKCKLISH